MKKNLSLLVVAMSLLCSPVFSQSAVDTTNKLGLAGDNLDLYAVLTLFQKSKTIEGFEKSLNDEQNKINNLDLNMDKKVDFIKVTTTQEKKDSAFRFVLQVDVTKTETQDAFDLTLDSVRKPLRKLARIGQRGINPLARRADLDLLINSVLQCCAHEHLLMVAILHSFIR